MYLQAALSSILLLLTDVVISYEQVSGVEGQPVTLPCTYSTDSGAITTMCWGRGACPVSRCGDEIIWTNGSHVTFQKSTRYKLKGKLMEGNVSLTIEDAAQADSDLYCCRVELSGWFNDIKRTLALGIKPAIASSPTLTEEPQPPTTQETSLQPTSLPAQSCPTDGNGNVTQSSNGSWHQNQTLGLLPPSPWALSGKGLYVGLAMTAVALLFFLVILASKNYLCRRNKMEQLSMVSLNGPSIGTSQGAAEVSVRAEDNIYVIEDNPYVTE